MFPSLAHALPTSKSGVVNPLRTFSGHLVAGWQAAVLGDDAKHVVGIRSSRVVLMAVVIKHWSTIYKSYGMFNTRKIIARISAVE